MNNQHFFRAGTFRFIGGSAVSGLIALTGFWDWLRSTEKGTQARRTANTLALTMMFETALALVDFALRLNDYHARVHPTVPVLFISIVVAALVAVGATFGGSLVFEHGSNVEIAGDSPAWHVSETDVMPGDRPRLKMRCLPSNDSPTPKWLSRAGHRTHSNTTREEGRAA